MTCDSSLVTRFLMLDYRYWILSVISTGLSSEALAKEGAEESIRP